MILSKKHITKALIRLHRCAGWSAALLFRNTEDGFSRVEAHMISTIISWAGGNVCKYGTENSEIFARVLFSGNFAYVKFRENNILANWRKLFAIY